VWLEFFAILAFVRCGFGFGFLYLMVFASINTPFVVFNKLVLLLIKKTTFRRGVGCRFGG
jgi:hypothetical protein